MCPRILRMAYKVLKNAGYVRKRCPAPGNSAHRGPAGPLPDEQVKLRQLKKLSVLSANWRPGWGDLCASTVSRPTSTGWWTGPGGGGGKEHRP